MTHSTRPYNPWKTGRAGRREIVAAFTHQHVGVIMTAESGLGVASIAPVWLLEERHAGRRRFGIEDTSRICADLMAISAACKVMTRKPR